MWRGGVASPLMTAKDRRELFDESTDLTYWAQFFGPYLRKLRTERGLSLRELERLSGVNDSDIHKIETEGQDCRLDSFIRLCAALGVPWGMILDDLITSRPSFFSKLLAVDADFLKILDEIGAPLTVEREYLKSQMASCCCVFAHLLRCSNPTRKAMLLEYPDPKLKESFLRFADDWTHRVDHVERTNVLSALKRSPLNELSIHRIEFFPFLKSSHAAWIALHLSRPKKLPPGVKFQSFTGPPCWNVWAPPIAFASDKKGI